MICILRDGMKNSKEGGRKPAKIKEVVKMEQRRNAKGEKLYPFNIAKHEHDIFYRYNRAKNELDENWKTMNREQFDKLDRLIDDLEELLGFMGGVVWLTGKQYGLAKESVIWADSQRTSTRYR